MTTEIGAIPPIPETGEWFTQSEAQPAAQEFFSASRLRLNEIKTRIAEIQTQLDEEAAATQLVPSWALQTYPPASLNFIEKRLWSVDTTKIEFTNIPRYNALLLHCDDLSLFGGGPVALRLGLSFDNGASYTYQNLTGSTNATTLHRGTVWIYRTAERNENKESVCGMFPSASTYTYFQSFAVTGEINAVVVDLGGLNFDNGEIMLIGVN